jgi:short-subunit dehydrogenase
VNVSSLGGRLGIRQEAAYSASKFALCGWSESMAADLWGTGVEVRIVNPGPIDTEIWDQPGNAPADYDGPLEPPSLVADAIVAAIEGDVIETYVPDLRGVVEYKTADLDGFVAGMVQHSR